jgi:hypothetical protein
VVRELDGGFINARFSVNLSLPSSEPVTVSYATANGSATADEDYASRQGILSFDAGVTNRTVDIPVTGDRVVETGEEFSLALSDVTRAAIGRGVGTCTIIDNDVFIVSVSNVTVPEGGTSGTNMSFTLHLSSPNLDTVSVDYRTADGSAMSGRDYLGKSGTSVFRPGTTNKFVSINILGNEANEIDRSFYFVLTGAENALVGVGSEAVGMILDDDPAPVFEITEVTWFGTDLHIGFGATAGGVYRLERTDELASEGWIGVGNDVTGDGTIVEVVDSDAASRSHGFYRIQRLQ